MARTSSYSTRCTGAYVFTELIISTQPRQNRPAHLSTRSTSSQAAHEHHRGLGASLHRYAVGDLDGCGTFEAVQLQVCFPVTTLRTWDSHIADLAAGIAAKRRAHGPELTNVRLYLRLRLSSAAVVLSHWQLLNLSPITKQVEIGYELRTLSGCAGQGNSARISPLKGKRLSVPVRACGLEPCCSMLF